MDVESEVTGTRLPIVRVLLRRCSQEIVRGGRRSPINPSNGCGQPGYDIAVPCRHIAIEYSDSRLESSLDYDCGPINSAHTIPAPLQTCRESRNVELY